MIDEKKISGWVNESYRTACEKGFHEEELSVPHMLMLILTEISEVVDADRRNRHADLQKYSDSLAKYDRGKIMYDTRIEYDVRFKDAFESYVKDTVEDELSDVVIRICDTCGALGIEPLLVGERMMDEFSSLCGHLPLCERCFLVSRILCDVDDDVIVEENNPKCVWQVLGSALEFVLCMCRDMGIDIENHVELKMRYNDMRPYRNGKSY